MTAAAPALPAAPATRGEGRGPARLGVLAALVLALVAALLLPGRPAAAATGGGPAVGVQFKGMWSDYTDAERATVLDQLAAAGATWVRIDVSWAMIQPTGPNSYDLGWGVPFIDRVLGMARARGLTPLVTLWLTPDWANGGAGDRVPPTNPADYARAARWAAQRWAGTVGAWEVWNEPNQSAFWSTTDPVAYARLLRAAYPAFHAGDPNAVVVSGGVAYNDDTWLARAYAAGMAGSFDVLAVHPYQGVADESPTLPDDGTEWRLTHVAAVQRLMAAHGDGAKPIWFTEFGWSSHPNVGGERNWTRGVSRQTQGDYFVATLDLLRTSFPYVTNVFWYTDHDRTDSGTQDDNYGLLDVNLAPKPALLALRAYTAARGGSPAPAPGSSSTPPGNGLLMRPIALGGRVAPVDTEILTALRVTR